MPTKVEKDSVTGTQTTGHVWDGIKELNTPLPRWWVYVLYATILWSVVYWVLYPSIPTFTSHTTGIIGGTARQALDEKLQEAREAQAVYLDRIQSASVQEIAASPDLLNFAIAGGRAAFADNCAPCHGLGGAGQTGYPSLADDDWLWGGSLAAIQQTVLYGIRAGNDETRVSEMPAFGADGILTPEQINDVAEYVLSLSDNSTDQAAAERGAPIFADNCAACHGEKGEGNTELGAPRLNDQIWLYGGSKQAIVAQVTKPRMGVMPAWGNRLDSSTIKMLTVYVHSLGGGQ